MPLHPVSVAAARTLPEAPLELSSGPAVAHTAAQTAGQGVQQQPSLPWPLLVVCCMLPHRSLCGVSVHPLANNACPALLRPHCRPRSCTNRSRRQTHSCIPSSKRHSNNQHHLEGANTQQVASAPRGAGARHPSQQHNATARTQTWVTAVTAVRAPSPILPGVCVMQTDVSGQMQLSGIV